MANPKKIIEPANQENQIETSADQQLEVVLESEKNLTSGTEKEPLETENQKIRQEIEAMDLDDHLKLQATSQASDIKALEDKAKIQKLLQTAKEKGVVFAVRVAKNMNDPFILDSLHDALAKNGYYKDFLK